MALVKYGATVAQLSGSVGGIVYARNKGGAYVRNRTSPLQPGTGLQVDARGLFQAAVRNWTNILTDNQRYQWNAYASAIGYTNVFGETRYYSGQQRYIQCYVACVNAGGLTTAAATAPTTYTAATNVVLLDLSATQGAATPDTTCLIANDSAPAGVAIGDKLLISFGGPITGAVNYFKGPYRFATSSTYASGNKYTFTVTTDPYARTLAAGDRLPISWRVLKADNRISAVSRGILTLGAHAA